MRGNVHVPLDQGFENESTVGVANSRLRGGNTVNSNYVSVQTGEEFSSEFIRDRLTPKVVPPGLPMVQNQEIRGGFNNEHDRQMGYEDLARILGIRRVDSECSSEVSEFASAQGCPPEVDHWTRAERRCHIDDSANSQGVWEDTGVLNFDQGNLGARVPPITIPHSPRSYNPYDVGSSDGSQPGKLRILCSFGGKILPRPIDGKLRYVGGETRMISIKKNISWEELTYKTSGICNQPHSIKYQLPGEDLDALISVSSNEDLQNMMEEYQGIEKSCGSQRLRIFLIPASETENRSSGTLQQASPDYEYVVAVNGIVDCSPRKASGEQVIIESNKSGATLDRIPSFYGDSPSSVHRVEIKDGSTSSQGAHVTMDFFNNTRSPVQSPSLSTRPAQPGNVKSGGVQWYEDSLWKHSGESNSSFVQTQLPSDSVSGKPSVPGQEIIPEAQLRSGDFIIPVTDGNQNNNGGQPSLASGRAAHHERYMSQVDSRAFMLGSADSMDSYHGMIHAYSDSQLQQYGEKSSYCSQEGVSPSSSLHFANPATSSQAFSSPLQEKVLPLQENIHIVKPEVQNQLMDLEPTESCKRDDLPIPHYSKPLGCNPYIEGTSNIVNDEYHLGAEDQDIPNPLMQNPYNSNPLGLQMTIRVLSSETQFHQGITDQNVFLSNPVENKLVNGNCFHINADAQGPQVHQQVPMSTCDAMTASEGIPKRQPDCQLESTSSVIVNIHEDGEAHHCNFTGELTGEALGRSSSTILQSHGRNREVDLLSGLSDDSFLSLGKQAVASPSAVRNVDFRFDMNSTKVAVYGGVNVFQPDNSHPIEKLEHRNGNGMTLSNDIGRVEPLNMHKQNHLEPLVVIGDACNYMPEEAAFPSVPPPAVDVFSNVSSEEPSVADGDGIGTELGSEDSKTAGLHKDDSVIDAVMAEIEAGLYGLQIIVDTQIIKNADLEELRELGSGTYGTVYHGKWRGSDVAIKRIKKSCFSGRSSEQERLTRDFWREAQLLSKLHHPNVVAFYGVVPDGAGGTLATVTEFMVNGSLRNVLVKKDRSLDRRRKLIIAMDAAFGMEYLHSKNIVHFDLKCDNLLVNMRDPQRPICKVGDFGLSRIKRNTLVSGGVRGTLPWMAPELLNGSSTKVSEKVDVFSFGIAMWEILTGEEPYANMHCGAIIGGILKNTLRPPIPERCDPEWRTLMEQCWSIEPDARPTFTEVTNRLRSMSAALPSKEHTRTLSGRG
uniref:Protein kinase domain-containing protein n=1 Tax=Chenopodium quinoa TaxID=63459 RepID=A0A803MLL6_CHEQI